MEFNDVVCPTCGDVWSKIGLHWHHNPDHRPSLTSEQKQIATGLLMGDGWLEQHGDNPILNIAVIEKAYLEYLDDVFGVMSTGVRLKQTAAESAAQMSEDFTTAVYPENYHDVWRMTIRTHPWLHNLQWYEDDGKSYPDNLDLTPLTFKHWYVCDGFYHQDDKYIIITIKNEIDNVVKMKQIFDSSQIPEPDAWDYDNSNIRWNQDSTTEIFELIGEPINGFEYKWK
jgi:hypothetical protein